MQHINRPGIIWDFDDTLVNTAIYFEEARDRFVRFMVDLGFSKEEVLDRVDHYDIENVKKCGGFLKDCFPSAMVQTYQYFCVLENKTPDPDISKTVENIGWWVFEQTAAPLPFAKEVLEEIRSANRFELILATKGDPTVQWRRIQESGLKEYFHKIFILRDKTIEEYRFITRDRGINPHFSWVIGNSIKSDINPGLQAGYQCLFIPNPYTWSYEMEKPAGQFQSVSSLDLVPDIILKEKRCSPEFLLNMEG